MLLLAGPSLYHCTVPYSTKVSRDKTFAVRSPCEYSRKNFRVCIKNVHYSVYSRSPSRRLYMKFAGKHSRFKGKPRKLQKFCPLNLLYYMVYCSGQPLIVFIVKSIVALLLVCEWSTLHVYCSRQ